jgi:hypothetical protein
VRRQQRDGGYFIEESRVSGSEAVSDKNSYPP